MARSTRATGAYCIRIAPTSTASAAACQTTRGSSSGTQHYIIGMTALGATSVASGSAPRALDKCPADFEPVTAAPAPYRRPGWVRQRRTTDRRVPSPPRAALRQAVQLGRRPLLSPHSVIESPTRSAAGRFAPGPAPSESLRPSNPPNSARRGVRHICGSGVSPRSKDAPPCCSCATGDRYSVSLLTAASRVHTVPSAPVTGMAGRWSSRPRAIAAWDPGRSHARPIRRRSGGDAVQDHPLSACSPSPDRPDRQKFSVNEMRMDVGEVIPKRADQTLPCNSLCYNKLQD